MIRPFTCVCLLLACGSGLYVYQTKHRALLLDREIGHTLKATEAVRERTTALRAEWALLNEPERLSTLSQQHLGGLRTLAPTQFVTLADLGARLPAPLPPGSFAPPPTEEEPPAPVVAELHPIIAPAHPAPEVTRPAPVLIAARAIPPRPATHDPAAVPVPPVRAPILMAQASPLPNPSYTPRPQITSQPLPPPAASVSSRPVPVAAPLPAARIAPVAPVQPVAAAPPPIASPTAIGEAVMRTSALGGGRPALPPPTPYAGR